MYRVASPCRADWTEMDGDDNVRACARCNKNVYNLSRLTLAEARTLIAEHGQPPCVRFFQRSDGTVMFADCTVDATGRVALIATTAVALLAGVLAIGEEQATRPELLTATVGALALPMHGTLQQLPVITITISEVSYHGQLVATTEHLLSARGLGYNARHDRIDALYDRLDTAANKILDWPPDTPQDQMVILSADPSTDARLIHAVTNTAEAAGYRVLYAMPNR